MFNFRSSVTALLAATKLAAADGPAASTPQALDSAALSGSSPATLSVGDRHAGAATAAAYHTMSLPSNYRHTPAANLDAAGGETRVGERQTGAGSKTSQIPTDKDIYVGLYQVRQSLFRTQHMLGDLSDLLTSAQGASKDPDRGAHSILKEALQETLAIKGQMQGIENGLQKTTTKVEHLLIYHGISDRLSKYTTLAAATLGLALGWLAKSRFSSRDSS